ncbi:MAG: hypothetical protein IH819_13680 [Bacteroidetes bacterium]|nr:hypothetical protein [Bacteroidota bacterium]
MFNAVISLIKDITGPSIPPLTFASNSRIVSTLFLILVTTFLEISRCSLALSAISLMLLESSVVEFRRGCKFADSLLISFCIALTAFVIFQT